MTAQALPQKIKKRRYGRRPPITLAGPPPATKHMEITGPVLADGRAPVNIERPLATVHDLGSEKQYDNRMRQTRNDPLGDMHARGQIDDAQFTAGRHWQWLYERSVVSIQAMDTSKEPVDGGGFPEPLTDGQMMAMQKLRTAKAAMGPTAARLIEDVLGHGMFITEAARIRGHDSLKATNGWRFIFQRALDDLALAFGLANRAGRRAG